MGSSKKTITDLQIVDLLEKGTAEAEGRRIAVLKSNGNAQRYGDLYSGFKKDYRKKYSPAYLEAIGYDPYTVATTRVINTATAKTYLIGKGIDVSTIQQVRSSYIDHYTTARHYLQENYDFVNTTTTLTYGGKTYKNLSVTNGTGLLTIKMTEPFEDTIIRELNTYGYDGTSVFIANGIDTISGSGVAAVDTDLVEVMIKQDATTVYSTSFVTTVDKSWNFTTGTLANDTYTVEIREDGVIVDTYTTVVNNIKEYVVGVIEDTVYDNGGIPSYKVDSVFVGNPLDTYTIYVPVEVFTVQIFEYSYEVLYIEYTIVGDTSDWYSYVEDLDTVPTWVYTAETINMTAVIPVKENNVVFDPNSLKLKRMLRKLGLESKDFAESLNDPGLDNAYVWTGLPISNTDQGSVKVIYRTFDLLASGSGNISVSISRLSMNYSFTITKSTHVGQIMEVGTYSKSLVGTDEPGCSDDSGFTPGSYSTLTLRYQGSFNEWKQIVITNYVNSYTVSGHSFVTYFTSSSDTGRLIVPLDVLNKLRYKEFVEVFETSLSMICYSITVVKVKWYQSGWFGALLKFVAIVILIYTWGTAKDLSAFLWGVATSIAIGVAATLVLKLLGPELGALAIIAAILVAASTGSLGFNLSTFVGYLKTASAILSTMDQAIQMKTQEVVLKGEKALSELASKSDALQEMYDSLRSTQNSTTVMIDNFNDTATYNSPNGVVDPDTYVAMMQGSVAYNYDSLYDVDFAYEQRKVVNSG